MANHAAQIRNQIAQAHPGATVSRRGREWIEHQIGPGQYQFTHVIGKLHYGPSLDQEIDDAWQTGTAPWDYEMTSADFDAFALADYDSGQIVKYVHRSGEELAFQPQQTQWRDSDGKLAPINPATTNGDPQAVTATVNDNVLTWTGAHGTDLNFRWIARPAGLTKEFIINNLAAIGTPPAEQVGFDPHLTVRFIFQKSINVEIFLNGSIWDEKANNPVTTTGIVDFRLKTTGAVLWRFHLPQVFDSDTSETPPDYTPKYTLRKTGPNLFIEVGVAWSELQTAVYPVIIDPSFSDQPDESNAEDCRISRVNATTNYETGANLPTDAGDNHALIRWDLSSISAGATCDAATMSLWSAASSGSLSYDIYVTIPAWVESQATWNIYSTGNNWTDSGCESSGNDYEADASPPSITYPGSSADTEATSDLTTGNNLDADRIATQFGDSLGLVVGVTGGTLWRSWHSSSVGTAGYRPKIAITYTEAGGGGIMTTNRGFWGAI